MLGNDKSTLEIAKIMNSDHLDIPGEKRHKDVI